MAGHLLRRAVQSPSPLLSAAVRSFRDRPGVQIARTAKNHEQAASRMAAQASTRATAAQSFWKPASFPAFESKTKTVKSARNAATRPGDAFGLHQPHPWH